MAISAHNLYKSRLDFFADNEIRFQNLQGAAGRVKQKMKTVINWMGSSNDEWALWICDAQYKYSLNIKILDSQT